MQVNLHEDTRSAALQQPGVPARESPAPPCAAAPEVSVILPVYNEAACIVAVLQELATTLAACLGRPFEILAVDDGSTDSTPALLARAAASEPRLRVLRQTPNAGQSAAFCTGFRAARGGIVVTLDADGQNDPADIPAVVARLADCDCCCGFRAARQDTASRRLASRLANAVRNRALDERIIDTGCSLKAFKKEFVCDLQPWDGLHRFLPSFVMMRGGRVAQIPVNHRPRAAGTSKYTNWKRLRRTIRDLRGVVWLKDRTRRFAVETVT
ncbi:MAG: glycosyltransferase family 2 protein [Kiritimatiellae bacterium]|nr:glycosyltransferase family 2 protein [Kiritimatiellia bacterium]